MARAMRLNNIIDKLYIRGIRGLSATNSNSYLSIPTTILRQRPTYLIVNIGTNDLASGICPLEVASTIVDCVHTIIRDWDIKHVYLCSALPRTTRIGQNTQAQFQELVYRFNHYLQTLCETEHNITYWLHRGFSKIPVAQWSLDGIHPNSTHGRQKFKSSMRHAVFRLAQLST